MQLQPAPAPAAARPGDGAATGAGVDGAVLRIGQTVQVAHFSGTIRFIGETSFATGRWVGIELSEAVGKNNGRVHDVTYFTCPQKHGIFVREAVVRPFDPSEAEDAVKPAADGGGAAPSLLPDAQFGGAAAVGESGVQDNDSDSSDGEPAMVSSKTVRERRFGVSAEAVTRRSSKSHSTWTPMVHPKSPEERQQLVEMVRTSHDSKLQLMFGSIPEETFEQVIDAMFLKAVAQGEQVIQLGDTADFFYIVKTGQFDILAKRHTQADSGRTGEQQLVKVFEAGAGFAFGELALLYNAPRSATITATEASEVWCLGREAFRKLVVQSSAEQFKEYVAFLKGCDIFHELSGEQIAALAEVLGEEDFEEDEAILEQGDKDNKMYILRKGKAVACIKGDQGEVEVMQYKQGDYFGEIALLLGEPRKASVYAVGPATCMYITRDTFNRVLGPLRDFLQRNIGKYQKYQDAITAAHSAEGHLAAPPDTPLARSSVTTPRCMDAFDEEVFDGGVVHVKSMKPVGRRNKRERTHTSNWASLLAAAGEEAAQEEAAEEAPKEPPASLADRVAQDFQKLQLVVPSDGFLVPGCHSQVFGGLRLGEKFKMDKVVLARGKATCSSDGLEDTYEWKGPCWLKGSTHMAALCQKGQKSPSDPTPNQDNYFALHIGSLGIYGVCDGHGPFGHLVSFRLVQTLPHFLTRSKHFGQDWAQALREAFLEAQRDLLAFCEAHDVNVEASGAAGSVLVFEGPSIHVAHIGDAGAMVASWNRRDSRLIFGTKDHKPQLPEERARLEAAGSEVREIDEESYRIYIKGTNFPGLTMSRAFGDTACGGVLQEPEYHQFFMQPGDEYYAIIASDGIWEFMEYDKVVELSAKKLRLKGPRETVRFITECSRKRWSHFCGDYCDDITALLVQWNVKDKTDARELNHELIVTRHE